MAKTSVACQCTLQPSTPLASTVTPTLATAGGLAQSSMAKGISGMMEGALGMAEGWESGQAVRKDGIVDKLHKSAMSDQGNADSCCN